MHSESAARSEESTGFRYASSIRARSTRLAGSVRDRAIAVSLAKSSLLSTIPKPAAMPSRSSDLVRESQMRLQHGAVTKNRMQTISFKELNV